MDAVKALGRKPKKTDGRKASAAKSQVANKEEAESSLKSVTKPDAASDTLDPFDFTSLLIPLTPSYMSEDPEPTKRGRHHERNKETSAAGANKKSWFSTRKQAAKRDQSRESTSTSMDSDCLDVIPFVPTGKKVSPELLDRVASPTISDRGNPPISKPTRKAFRKKVEVPGTHWGEETASPTSESTKEAASDLDIFFDEEQEVVAAFKTIEEILAKLPTTAPSSNRASSVEMRSRSTSRTVDKYRISLIQGREDIQAPPQDSDQGPRKDNLLSDKDMKNLKEFTNILVMHFHGESELLSAEKREILKMAVRIIDRPSRSQ
jgi:hypothetical protein